MPGLSFSFMEKAWVRSLLASSASLVIIIILLYSGFGAQRLSQFWIHLAESWKTFLYVVCAAYTAISFVVLMLRQSKDSSWSDISLNERDSGRFDELLTHREQFERYGEDRYGMNTLFYWPRIFLVLPADVKSAIGHARSQYIMSRIIANTFSNWYTLSSPIWCGVLMAIGFLDGRNWLCIVLSFGLILISYAIEAINPQYKLLFRNFSIILPFLMIFNRFQWLKTALLMLVGGVLIKCVAAFPHVGLNWPLLIMRSWDWSLDWAAVCTVSLEIVALGVIAQVCERWFISSGLSYGTMSCAVFDLYRKPLAEAMGLDFSSDNNSQRKVWKEHYEYLTNGRIFGGNSKILQIPKPKFSEQKKSPQKLLEYLIDDANLVIKDFSLLANSEYVAEGTSLQTTWTNTIAGCILLLVVELGKAVSLGLTFAVILPALNLLENSTSFSNCTLASFAIFTLLPLWGGIFLIPFCWLINRINSRFLNFKWLSHSLEFGTVKLPTYVLACLVLLILPHVYRKAAVFVNATSVLIGLVLCQLLLPSKFLFTYNYSLVIATALIVFQVHIADRCRNELLRLIYWLWFPGEQQSSDEVVPIGSEAIPESEGGQDV